MFGAQPRASLFNSNTVDYELINLSYEQVVNDENGGLHGPPVLGLQRQEYTRYMSSSVGQASEIFKQFGRSLLREE